LELDELIAHAEELARRWSIALILGRTADRIGEVPLEELAREAPTLCAQVLRAVQSDAELDRLTRREPSGARDGGAIALLRAVGGEQDAAALVRAVEAMRGALWEALLEVVQMPPPRLLGDLSDRLAHVCAALLGAALDASPSSTPSSSSSSTTTAITSTREPPVDEAGSGSASQRPLRSPLERRAVVVDEWADARERVSPGPPLTADAEIAIHDQRHAEEGPYAWVGSIGVQLERFERERRPFAVLLVELLELEDLRRDEPEEELRRLAGRLEDALRRELGVWSGSLTRERPGRCWLLVPGADRTDAERLAERLQASVPASVGGLDGECSPALVIGTAVCPDDGRQAAALAAHADVGLYAARAAARRRSARVEESA
jgi:GGDEF domain-containing protein